jgi:hypothetical protein
MSIEKANEFLHKIDQADALVQLVANANKWSAFKNVAEAAGCEFTEAEWIEVMRLRRAAAAAAATKGLVEDDMEILVGGRTGCTCINDSPRTSTCGYHCKGDAVEGRT